MAQDYCCFMVSYIKYVKFKKFPCTLSTSLSVMVFIKTILMTRFLTHDVQD